MIFNKPHGNIIRRIYLNVVLKIACVKLKRENRHLHKELDKLKSILSKEEF
jgi:hypothetical protein